MNGLRSLMIPGKDSYRHRQAGASEVLVSSGVRWAQMLFPDDPHFVALAYAMAALTAQVGDN